MYAEELMIGDWIQIVPDAPAMQNEYHRVDWIRTGEIGLDNRSIVIYPYVQPIPLIPEILEKNGLRKLVTYGTEKWVCDNFRLNVYDSGETWRFCADTNRNEDSVIYVRFFHELQHALRLCGIEKTIEL